MNLELAARFVKADGIYLLSHSVGRPLANSREALVQNFFVPWEQGPGEPWSDWMPIIDSFRQSLARLLNSTLQNFCPQVNVSSAVTKVIHSLPMDDSRPTILLSPQDFPSIGFVLSLAQRRGYRLKYLAADEDVHDIDVWSRYLTPDVRFALITHVHSNTSRQVPIEDIVRLARERQVMSIVDIAQSVGVVPIDLATLQPDFLTGSCVKWLCGGPGAGFLWVNDNVLADCEPIDVGWFSHQDPFAFDIHDFRYAEDAQRFWGGTPSLMPYVLASHAIDTLVDIGIDVIRAHNLALTNALIGGLGETNLRTPVRPEQRGGTLVLDPGELGASWIAALREAQVHFDTRRGGLRLSPHVYNTVTEIETVLQCLAEA